MIVFDKIGILLNGDLKGWNITIQDDTNETGGYYVLEWSPNDSTKGYDGWYENYEMLLLNLKGKEIEWTNQDYVPRIPTEEEIKKAEDFRALAKKKGF